MLKPEQMDALPVDEVSPDRLAGLERETAVVDGEGRVVGVVFSPGAYAETRAAFFDFAAALPEGVTVIGRGARQLVPRPADWPFPADGPPPPMRDVLAHLMKSDAAADGPDAVEQSESGRGDAGRREAA